MSLLIVSASEHNNKKTLLFESLVNLRNTGLSNKVELRQVMNNTEGLSKVYNRIIEESAKFEYDFIAFVHDDVWIDDALILQKIQKYSKQYDIIGLAGGLNPKITEPILWHIMCKREDLRGYVNHFHTINGEEVTYMTSFGQTPARVAMIDGVFMCINVKTIGDWRFNENYDFHCYDLASCLDANKKGLKIGVAPINVIHKSHGLSSLEDPIFRKNQAQFLKEYTE